ncbi:hypothetical protein LAZ67_23000093 [Cordylochernes scorpioides]|uniref:Transposase n=1 Tax=Cordylochernes scorpioides TaxID=51811 RepID=A0ABY6LQP8_9ARAC|nr:hypothetical protein LAZ67_23000093 [Cordylochernes scorpioides]
MLLRCCNLCDIIFQMNKSPNDLMLFIKLGELRLLDFDSYPNFCFLKCTGNTRGLVEGWSKPLVLDRYDPGSLPALDTFFLIKNAPMTPDSCKIQPHLRVEAIYLRTVYSHSQKFYLLRRLRESIRKKRPERWISGEWLLHHDNAPAHRALSLGAFLTKNSMLTMPHPPYSPDLAPNDFFLFPRIKSVLKGHRFDTVNAIKEKSLSVLRDITSEEFSERFRNWKKERNAV